MITGKRGFAVGVGVALIAATTTGVVAAEAPTPAAVYEPPSDKVLQPSDITFERNKRTGTVAVKDRDGAPLAITSIEVFGSTGATVRRVGADFTSPALWQKQGFGNVCSSLAPDTDPYVLPNPDSSANAPAGDWEYQNVIVTTSSGPIVYNLPQPGQFVTGQGAAMESVINCLRPAGGAPVPLMPRAETSSETPTQSPSTEPSRAATSASPSSSPSASPTVTSSPSPSVSVPPSSEPTASPTESASPSPTATPTDDSINVKDPLIDLTLGKKNDKVRICHATSAGEKNPYTSPEVGVSAANLNGHADHERDIIPPDSVDADPDGRNWDSTGEAIYKNGCDIPSDGPGFLRIGAEVVVPAGVQTPSTLDFDYSCVLDGTVVTSGTGLSVPTDSVGTTISDIPAGSQCTVNESSPILPSGYALDVSYAPDATVTISSGDTTSVTVTNELISKNGSLRVDLAPTPGDPSAAPFTVYYHCYGFHGIAAGSAELAPTGDSVTWTVPSESRCIVGEQTPTAPQGYDYVPVIDPDAVWIAGNEQEVVAVSNELVQSNDVGELELRATLSGAPDGYTPDFDVSYRCAVAGQVTTSSVITTPGASTTVPVTAGSQCEVVGSEATEPAPDGYGFAPFNPPAAVTINAGGVSTITAVNDMTAPTPDPIVNNKNVNLTSMCKPAPDVGQWRLRGPAGANWTLKKYGSSDSTSGVFDGADVFVDVPWSSPGDTWILTATGADGSNAKKSRAIGDNDACTSPSPSPEPIEPSEPAEPGSNPGNTPVPVPANTPASQSDEVTEVPVTQRKITNFCKTDDASDLPAEVVDAEVAMTVTNGVSEVNLQESWTDLFCVTQGLPATLTPASAKTGTSPLVDGGSDDAGMTLADTGAPARPWLPALVVLLGAALILLPTTRRRT